jgi:hypothetical protein
MIINDITTVSLTINDFDDEVGPYNLIISWNDVAVKVKLSSIPLSSSCSENNTHIICSSPLSSFQSLHLIIAAIRIGDTIIDISVTDTTSTASLLHV